MQISLKSTTTRRLLGGLLGIVVIGAACGGDGDGAQAELPNAGSESAASAGSDNESEGTPERMSEAEMTRVLEEYRDCMVEELPAGAAVSVGMANGEPQIDITVDSASDDDTSSAEETCQPILAELERSFTANPEVVAERRDAALFVQRCMAEEGYDITVDDDGGIGFDTNDSEFDEAAYLEAENACIEQAEAERG